MKHLFTHQSLDLLIFFSSMVGLATMVAIAHGS